MVSEPLAQLSMKPTERTAATWKSNGFLLTRLLLIVVALLGATLFSFQVHAWFMARESSAWPSTSGILSVTTDAYRRNLSYRYAVDGVSYVSERVIFGELGNRTRSEEWNAVADQADGSEVRVHYRPTNPPQSTLVTRLQAGSGFHLLLGAAFFLVSGIVWFFLPAIQRTIEQQTLNHERD